VGWRERARHDSRIHLRQLRVEVSEATRGIAEYIQISTLRPAKCIGRVKKSQADGGRWLVGCQHCVVDRPMACVQRPHLGVLQSAVTRVGHMLSGTWSPSSGCEDKPYGDRRAGTWPPQYHFFSLNRRIPGDRYKIVPASVPERLLPTALTTAPLVASDSRSGPPHPTRSAAELSPGPFPSPARTASRNHIRFPTAPPQPH